MKPDWMMEDDPLFHSLYTKFLRGRISCFVTRLPLEDIRPGFYVPAENFRYVCDQPPEDVIDEQMQDIRRGARRPLHVYANQNSRDPVRFLCPDEVVLHIAYQRLGIQVVPAIVLSAGKDPLPYSMFEARVQAGAEREGARITGIVSAAKPTEVSTIVGKTLPDDPVEVLGHFKEALQVRIARLRLFHTMEAGQLHYHHMLFSALVRAHETLQAVELLIQQNLWYQALALLRVLYEIHLNFYFDWLQPESNYRYLAMAAVLDANGLSRERQSSAQELMGEGLSRTAAEARAALIWRPVAFASSVVDKARLPQVGILYHKQIYSFLSQVLHQDFEVASLYANRFEDEQFLVIEDNLKSTYLRFIDIIVGEFVHCMEADIGTPPSPDVLDSDVPMPFLGSQ